MEENDWADRNMKSNVLSGGNGGMKPRQQTARKFHHETEGKKERRILCVRTDLEVLEAIACRSGRYPLPHPQHHPKGDQESAALCDL